MEKLEKKGEKRIKKKGMSNKLIESSTKKESDFTKKEGSIPCSIELLCIFDGPSVVTDANSGYSGAVVARFSPNLVKSKP